MVAIVVVLSHSFIPKPTVLGGCPSVMTGLAKWLPISVVIEQGKIAAMGDNVVHNRGSSQAPILLAFRAQRMDGQER